MTIEEIILTAKMRVLSDGEISALLSALKSVKKKEVPTHPLIKYINEHFPIIMKLKEPLTDEEATRIVDQFDKEAIVDVLMGMANKKTLLKDYSSANLTIRNWMKRRPDGGLKKTNLPPKQHKGLV